MFVVRLDFEECERVGDAIALITKDASGRGSGARFGERSMRFSKESLTTLCAWCAQRASSRLCS